jgi:hypothetical protein
MAKTNWNNQRRWFVNTFGFEEPRPYDQVQNYFRIEKAPDGSITLQTIPDGNGGSPLRSFHVGIFETPSVEELEIRLDELSLQRILPVHDGEDTQSLIFRHIVADVGDLHRCPENHGAVFQAASQFNCLEMVSPTVRPDDGITGYANDRTQGPVCAMAAPAATLYRNYFWNGTGQCGGIQNQMDLLSDVGKWVGNFPNYTTNDGSDRLSEEAVNTSAKTKPMYWNMRNGYALPIGRGSIQALRRNVLDQSWFQREAAIKQLRVGVHWDTEVQQHLQEEDKILVTQIYCSALPIGYDSSTSLENWEPFARIVLDGAYEATLAVAAILSRQRDGARVKVFLTKLGGGVFQNSDCWIAAAIQRSLHKYRHEPLDVSLVHYGDIEHYYVKACGKGVAK